MASKQNKPAKEAKNRKKLDDANKQIQTILDINNLPEEIVPILEDLTNVKNMEVGNIEKLLKVLKKYMMEISGRLLNCDYQDATESKNDHAIMSSCISVVKWVVDSLDSKDIKHSFSIPRIYTMFASFLIADSLDFRLRNQMSSVCEKLVDDMVEEDCIDASLLVVIFILDLTLNTTKAPMKADIKRVWSIHKTIGRLNLEDPVLTNLVDKLMTTVTHKNYLSCKEGRQHIAYLMTLSIPMTKKIYAHIIERLPYMSKNVAANYGDVLYIAWNTSLSDQRKEIEENCIQDLMRRIFVLKRNGLNFDRVGQIVFEILKQLHDSRRTYAFSTTITTLYTPLIWRYLRSGHPLERCNAAQVFMHVFPLEKPASGFVENIQLKERQFKEIMDLLIDDYHIVRIIAIKGVCNHLMLSLDCFAIIEIKSLLKTLAETLANDGSTYQVRLAVFEGFASMIKNKDSAKLLEPILPQMANHIHDENEKVRCAFLKILQNIKDSEYMSINYWKVVPVDHLSARLELEGPTVGEPLVKLLMSEIYLENIELEKFVHRLLRLVAMNSKAARKLFQYSSKVLKLTDVRRIILGILGFLKLKTKELIKKQKEADENDSSKEADTLSRPPREKQHEILADVSNVNIDERNKPTSSNDTTINTPTSPRNLKKKEAPLNRGLLDCAGTVWLVFSDQLNLPENETYQTELYTTACNSIPLFLRVFKDTEMYYATIYFASLVPLGKLTPLSTISGACMSELKHLTNTTPANQTQCLVYSLCAWNRGCQVIDLAVEWLDYAFRLQQLNISAMPKEGKRKRKVRFELAPGKPLLGLKLLDSIFCDVINEKRLLNKSYDQLYELYIYLERIKILIERRVESGFPFPDVELCDEFLHLVLKRYVLLAHTLHRPDKPPESMSVTETEDLIPINAAQISISLMEWADSVLIMKLPDCVDPTDEKSLIVNCLTEILRSSIYCVQLNTADMPMCNALVKFAIQLLSTGCSIWFVEDCLGVVQTLTAHAEVYTPNDEWGLMKDIIPSLYSKCLDTFVETLLDKDNIQYCVTNKGIKLRSGLISYLSTLSRMCGKTSDHFIETCNMLINCCIHMVHRRIIKDGEIESAPLTDQPFMVGLIMKILLSNASFTANVIPSFHRHFKLYSKDGNLLASCISLLNSVVRTYLNKLNRTNLESLMLEAFATLMQCKKSTVLEHSGNTSHTSVNESSFLSNEDNLDPVKYAESILVDLGQFSCCALMPSNINLEPAN